MFRWTEDFPIVAPPLGMPVHDGDDDLARRFRAFINDPRFPCVGAKSAMKKGDLRVVVARDIGSNWDDQRIHTALLGFIASYRNRPDLFQSFAVIFQNEDRLSEAEFEANLWTRVQSICDKDRSIGHGWDSRVASDPDNPHFSLSVAGEAFFVVGLHPGASRPARRFEAPVLVFNLHDQFEKLRAAGRYEKLRASILERDEALAGSINPMLSRHGELSEARQYSGRAVDGDWACPFRAPSNGKT